MATPYARRMFNGGALTTTVPLQIGAADSSFTLASATNWPDGSTGNFVVVVDQGSPEKILCSARSGNVVTVAASGRGYDGSSAVSHVAGSQIQCIHAAQDDDEANQVVSAVLGQTSAAKGDIPAILSAAGPVTMTRVPIGTTGQLLGVSSGLPAWQYPALTSASGSIGSPVSINNAVFTKIFDTASLGVGTWWVTMSTVIENLTASAVAVAVAAAVDTATATLTGVTGAETADAIASSGEDQMTVTFIAVVTVAGTLKFSAYISGASGGTALSAAVVQTSLTQVTGYTALRIA